MTRSARSPQPAIRLLQADLQLGSRRLWSDLNLEIAPGEFVAVLGPNGSGKTSLLRVLLGLTPLSAGRVEVAGQPPRRGSSTVGYIPQQKAFDPQLPIRGRDLVRLGADGHRFGPGWRLPSTVSQRLDQIIREVDAGSYADTPVGLLSGGEQQRLRIAQALLSSPQVLLCDEPLLSLDPAHQSAISHLIDQHRRAADMAVLFVTHDINPILPLVDRVLYLAGGRWTIGTPQDVFQTETLSHLYGAPVDVLRAKGRVIIMGAGETGPMTAGEHHK